MKKRMLICIALVTFIFAMPDHAMAQFTLDAQLRPRFELRSGYKGLVPEGSVPAFLISQRTRLMFTYQNDWLRVKFVPQDVRIWGDEQNAGTSAVFGDAASLDLHEAYAEMRLGPLATVTMGRQELVYDNQSLLSNRNWNQNGSASDAVLLRMRSGKWNLHVAGSWNTFKESGSNNFFLPDRLKSLNFLWLNRRFDNGLGLSFLQTASGITPNDTTNLLRFRHTSGLYTDWLHRYFAASGNLYYQYGRNREGIPVSAWLADAEASRRFGKFVPGIGIGYLSGNSAAPAALTTDRLFDDLYRAKHKFFGFMDYFSHMPSATKQGGLADYYAYFEYRITGTSGIKNTGHWFMLAQTNPSTPGEPSLGYENDLVLTQRFRGWVQLELGYLLFVPTENLRKLQGVPDAKISHFAYLQLTITPVFSRSDN